MSLPEITILGALKDCFKELRPIVVSFQQPVWERNRFLSNSLDSRISLGTARWKILNNKQLRLISNNF